MSYQKNAVSKYQLAGGVNQKASQYSTALNQVLDLRNLDFFVPNALQKTPGSTQAVAQGLSAPVTGLFEYQKLAGESYLLAATRADIFKAGPSFQAFGVGMSNAPATDFLTFTDTCYLANGQRWLKYNGQTLSQMGAPAYPSIVSIGPPSPYINLIGTAITVMGATFSFGAGQNRAVLFAAWGFVRDDGYLGPVVFPVAGAAISPFTGQFAQAPLLPEYVVGSTQGNYGNNVTMTIKNIIGVPTATPGYGISALALYLALDVFTDTPNIGAQSPFGNGLVLSGLVKPDVDPTQFYLFTTLPLGTTQFSLHGITRGWTQLVQNLPRFSAMTFDPFGSSTVYQNGPKFQEINQNRMFVAGFTLAPSVLRFSEVAAPETYNADAYIEVRTNDGDQITAIRTFQNQLMVFKKDSFHKLIGTDETNFQLVELSTEYGCVNNRAIAESQNFLLFLDQEGVVQFNGANFQIISLAIDPIIRRMNVSAAFEQAVALHYVERNQVWFGIPIDGSSVNNITLVYDYILNAWTFVDGFNPASFAQVKQGLNKKTMWMGDYSGTISYFSPSFLSYNGRAITCVIRTSFDAPDGADVQNMYRRLFLDVNRVTGATGEIKAKVLSDYDPETTRATFSIYQNDFQTRADFGVGARSIAFELSHAHVSCPFLMNGYTVQRRFLRKV